MEFDYQITDATLLLSPERGFEIACGCKIDALYGLRLKSGRDWADAVHTLNISPASTGEHQQQFEDGRVGEFYVPLINVKGHGHGLYQSWLQIPDDQFNVLYGQMAQGNLKIHIQICFNEDQDPATSSGVYDDTSCWPVKIPIMTYRTRVTLISYITPQTA